MRERVDVLAMAYLRARQGSEAGTEGADGFRRKKLIVNNGRGFGRKSLFGKKL